MPKLLVNQIAGYSGIKLKTVVCVPVLCSLLLIACAHTPSEVRQSHFRFQFQSDQTKVRSAACAARNAEGISPRFSTTTRPGLAEDTVEVIVHAGEGTAIVIDARGTNGGPSELTIWLTSNIGTKEDMQDYAAHLANRIVEGC